MGCPKYPFGIRDNILHECQSTEKYIVRNKNKPGPSSDMPLFTLKLYYNDPPKMGWPLKTLSRTRNSEKNINFF